MKDKVVYIIASVCPPQRTVRMLSFRLILTALLSASILNGFALADERFGLYRMLLSEERSMLEAVRRLSVNELLTFHNETIRAAGDGKLFNRTSAPGCANAYIHLALAALAYAVAIEPERAQPIKSPSENAAWGDQIWGDYLGYMASCENALDIAPLPQRLSRPSELLRRVLPPISKQN
jgi:hypothetical protein